MSKNVQVEAAAQQEQENAFWTKLLAEYAEVSANPYSLKGLFPEMDGLCEGYTPHPDKEDSDRRVMQIAKDYDLWLEYFSASSVSMTGDLHRKARIEAGGVKIIDTFGLYYHLLFYVDDTLTANADNPNILENKERYEALKKYAYALQVYLSTGENASAGNALLEFTKLIIAQLGSIVSSDYRNGQEAAATWLKRFLHASATHLAQALRHDNTVNLGSVLTPLEFFGKRIHDSGMETTLALMEVAAGKYIDWEDLAAATPQLHTKLIETREKCALIGGLLNDYFSFHKEVIAEPRSDFNLITVLMRHEKLSLRGAIERGAVMINALLQEFKNLTKEIEHQLESLPLNQAEAIHEHLEHMLHAIQATWIWELYGTLRYLSKISAFRELLLKRSA